MNKGIIIVAISCLVLLCQCLDPYNAPSTKENLNYLVVDAFLNGTDKYCKVALSRSSPLTGTAGIVIESNATVWLEDENGTLILLPEEKPGEYSKNNLPLAKSIKYRIKIVTQDGKEYVSDFSSVLATPPISDVTWEIDRVGLNINVSTADASNKTHYYQWRFNETWLYKSAFDAVLKLENGSVVPLIEGTYKCWRSNASTDILINSSKNLDEDVISDFTLTTVPWSSPRLSEKYSTLVEQRALTKDAYDYQLQLKKNTEELGTLFDPLPSRIIGNITCTTSPDEFVLGYFTASQVQKKRMFVAAIEIKRPSGVSEIERGYERCMEDTLGLGKNFGTRAPIRYRYVGLDITGYFVSETTCVDCRYQGGTNIKPDFWED